jgi:very-short-patch-repair endonuclease
VNYAAQQNHVPVIKRLRLTNDGPVDLPGVIVSVAADPHFAALWSIPITLLPAGQPVDLGAVDMSLEPAYLAGLNERVTGALTAAVSQAGQVIGAARYPVDVLAFDEWSGGAALPDLIAAFVTPNHPAVADILREAADLLGQWTGSASLNGYQSRDPNRARMHLAAIYSVLQGRRIVYCVPPASFEETGQKIRPADDILGHRLATCLDLAVLYAACAEQAGLHPLIVFTQGHAFAGAWLVGQSFPDSVQDDLTLLSKRVGPGAQEICLVETTALCDGQDVAFDEAVALAEEHLSRPEDFRYFVDIRRARAANIRPLPSRIAGQQSAAAPLPGPATPPAAPPQEMGQSAAEMAPAGQSTPATRLDQWQRGLLDLSGRNSLVSFRMTGGSIPLLTPDPAAMEDAFASGGDFQIYPRPEDWEGTPRDSRVYERRTNSNPETALLMDELGQGRLRADLPEKDLGVRLTKLYRSARSSMEENGANTLFLTVGMLVWYESPESSQARYAPLLLIPVDLARRSVRTSYVLRARDDEAQINVTLLEKIRQDFGLDTQGLDDLPLDEHGVDVNAVLARVRRAVMNMSRWNVIPDACLGLFSFNKFVMWHDLNDRSEDLARSEAVASLVAGRPLWTSDGHLPEADLLDRDYHPKDVFCPVSADSSQMVAICGAGAGNSFVLYGPPGTGKSQTITNIIANALGSGKTVLFVAEKMAALGVVQRRLSAIGLGPFCLELHSNKSRKADVLEQLKQSLEVNRDGGSPDWLAEANRLASLRDELNAYVHALHRRRETGESVFDALARLSALRDTLSTVKFDSAALASLTPDRLRQWRELTHQLRVAGEASGHPYQHVWADCQRTDWTPSLPAQAADLLSRFRNSLAQWENTAGPVEQVFQVAGEKVLSHRDICMLLLLAQQFLKAPAVPTALLKSGDWAQTRPAAAEWAAHGRARDALRTSLYERYAPHVLELDLPALQGSLRQAEQQWMLPRWLGRSQVARILRSTLKPGSKLGLADLGADLDRLQQLRVEEGAITAAGPRAQDLLGQLWNEGQPDWDGLDAALNWVADVRKTASSAAGADMARAGLLLSQWADVLARIQEEGGPDSGLGQQLRAFVADGDAVVTAWQALAALLSLSLSGLVDDPIAPGWFARIQERVAGWASHLDDLRNWCAWERCRTEAAGAGLGPVIQAYEGGLQHNLVEPVFERGFYQAWAELTIAGDSVLASFSRGLFEDRIRQFRQLDDRFAELGKQELYARLAARVPRNDLDAAQSSELGILKHEILKQRNYLALRTLFQRIPNVMGRLKPCLLMSPLSVAQYLDPAHPPFDLVVFDEASQVPTCDAVGAIARGHKLVIVGDPKQLPPTSFFKTADADADDDDVGIQDLESILDDCLAVRMHEEHLRWHYRSRHESLIAFSNFKYYDNKLLTFPSADDLTPAVRWRHIEGIYDRGKSKQNRAEAEAVVAEVARRLNDPDLARQSIGVVTFSQPQQRLVEDLWDEELKNHPELEARAAGDGNEPVFFKNLENVQGDERDVILFSVGYGPDSQGRVGMNFGPLNKDGGCRRLNVAVSRARCEMVVFSSLRADQIDLSRTMAQGVRDLKTFLEYADRGPQALEAERIVVADAQAESPFEEQVAQALRERGHEVHLQVGCSGYRIDMAVVDPDAPGRYLLGIECDGATYHSAKTARDRDKLRQAVLEGLGWRLHRIWSTDWWAKPDWEMQRLEAALAAARGSAPAPVPALIPDTPPASGASAPVHAAHEEHGLSGQAPASSQPGMSARLAGTVAGPYAHGPAAPMPAQEPVYAGEPYLRCRLEVSPGQSADLYEPRSTGVIAWQMTRVINAEGPISADLLFRRVRQAWGMARSGSRIRERLEQALVAVRARRARVDGADFFWPPGLDPATYDRFRVPGDDPEDRRDPKQIAPQEMAGAAAYVLRVQIGLPEADLAREMARLFGYQQCGPNVQAAMQAGIRLAIERGVGRLESGGQVVYAK